MKRPKSEPCGGQRPVLGRRLPEVVRRDRDDDREHPVLDVERQLPEVLALHDDRAVLGQERVEEDRVGLLHRADELRDAARWGAPRSSAIETVWRTRVPPPTPIMSLCLRAQRRDLRDERAGAPPCRGRRSTARRSPTSTTLGMISNSRSESRPRDDLAVDQRLAHQARLRCACVRRPAPACSFGLAPRRLRYRGGTRRGAPSSTLRRSARRRAASLAPAASSPSPTARRRSCAARAPGASSAHARRGRLDEEHDAEDGRVARRRR